ncbi:MAG: glycosyltransferase family 4 protein [Anaerolineae bacterium]|nr:glycosyltransferase family 4 protein [Anaerolineae bacterium]
MSAGESYRILAIAPTPFFVDRGSHVHIYEQARALQNLGHRVEICTYHIGREMPDITTHRIAKIGWYNKLDAGPSYHKLYLMVLLFFLSWRQIKRFQPDLLHAHGWDGCWIAASLSKLTGIPFIFDMQGSFSGEIVAHKYARSKGWFYKLLRRIERWTLHLTTIVTPSQQMIDEAIRDFRVPPERIYHIYDGVDTDEFRPDIVPSPELRDQLKLPAGKKIVVFVGLLKAYQGVDSLLDAIKLLIEDCHFTAVHFLIMGFPDEDLYRAKAASTSIGAYCSFPGKINYKRLPEYLRLGDLAVAPKISPTEGDGKIYNYLAMGLPVVAYERPASKEILGDNAFYAELANPRALAQALLAALTDATKAAQLGQRGRQLAMDKYSWLAVARRLLVAYEDVIRRAHR